MQELIATVLLWLALAWGGVAQAQNALADNVVKSEQSRAELLVDAPEGVAPGKPLWLGLQIEHAPHWHTYWKNSGDSGLPTELQWTLPAGVSVGDIAWPTPRRFALGELANYGYNGTVLLPVPLKIGPDFRGDALEVGLQASWLICRRECIPQAGQFKLRVPANVSSALHHTAFEAAWAAAPQALRAGKSSLKVSGGQLKVSLEGLPSAWRGKALEFFPETAGLIVPGAAWTQTWQGSRWSASLPLSPQRTDSPESLPLVVTPSDPAGQGPGMPGARSVLVVEGGWPAVGVPGNQGASPALQAALEQNAMRAASASTDKATSLTLWSAVLGALLGGLILNLMPCVFPVLAIKVVAFARHSDDHRAHRVAGLAYSAGAVLSFLALGGLLLALRAAGEQLGWGFQLQNPMVVAGMAVLFTLLGLNLAGLFEFGSVLPQSWASMQARHPVTDAFLTGVLATAVASPCTAPFMGASLGLAIGLPTWQALAVFTALGLGMALPYLVASWIPAVARALPKPGAWMETFRQFMAFPMFLTVVWLLWVLGQQTGVDGASAMLMLLVGLALLIWALGRRGPSRWMLSVAVALAMVWLLDAVGPYVTRTTAEAEAGAPTALVGLNWEAWTADKQAQALAQGRPVLTDFTAAWCVTCQYNKRGALADSRVLQEAARRNVLLLRADWTRRDPFVTAALAALGRNGVPTYALLAPGRPPEVLNEVLSADEVLSALARLPR